MNIRNYHINHFHNFEMLEKIFEAKFIHTSKLSTLNINNRIGKGEILCVRHVNGIVTFNLNIKFHKTLIVPINSNRYNTVQFFYSLNGNVKHNFDARPKIKFLKASYPAIIVNKKTVTSNLKFENKSSHSLNIISLRRNVYTKIFKKDSGEFAIKALKFINDLNDSNEKVLIGKHNLKIAKHVKSYFEFITHHNDKEMLSTEGCIYHILSSHFQRALAKNVEGLVNELNFSELKKVSDLGNYIQENPDIQYNVQILTSMSSLTAAKLQKGFKLLFNRTVSDFIRHIRLQRSEQLMVTTDLNISEIVYSIGFSSRSYFSKIFRREFGCSPKEYKSRLKETSKLNVHD